jgi:hypothetical protein
MKYAHEKQKEAPGKVEAILIRFEPAETGLLFFGFLKNSKASR